jgi:hypothetical protein
MAKKQENKQPQPSNEAAADFTEKESYVPKDSEKKFYHVELSKGPKFDSETGEPITANTYIQKFKVKAYKQFEKNAKGLGIKCKVLWTPEAEASNVDPGQQPSDPRD